MSTTIAFYQYLDSTTKTPADYSANSIEIPGPFKDLDHIKEVNIASGGHYFDRGAMKGFRSRPYHECFHGRFFIDSIQFVSHFTDYKEARKYKILAVKDDGSTSSVVAQDHTDQWCEFFPTLATAKSAIERLVKNAQAPTWANQLTIARNMETSELKRHADVSSSNRHRCENCFCCAALTVIEERQAKTGVK